MYEDALCGTMAFQTKSGPAFHFTFSTELSGNLLAAVLLIFLYLQAPHRQ